MIILGNPVPISVFLGNIEKMSHMHLTYRQPGDGSDGTCDCIGLIIGSIRRSGGSWTGIHGSNYAARYETDGLIDIETVNDLYVGMVVYKFTTDQKDLPARYKKNGSMYNGDMNDYYHVGVVMSVNPLQIYHMTTPTVKIDKSLGKWRRGGRLKKVTGYFGEPIKDSDGGAVIVAELYKMRVTTQSGPLNMRKKATTSSEIVDRIPNGTIIPIFDDSSDMYLTEYKNKKGYVSKAYLTAVTEGDNSSKTVGIFIELPENVASIVLEAMKNAKLKV